MTVSRFQRILLVVVSVCLIAVSLPLATPVGAMAEEDPFVVIEPDARVLLNAIDVMEDDFNHATVDWTVTGGQAEAITQLNRAPYGAFEGSRSLCLRAEGGSVTLERKPTTLTSLEYLRFFTATVWAEADAGNAAATLTVTTKRGSYEVTRFFTAGRWQVLFFALPETLPEGAVTSLSLTLTGEKEGATFLLDCVGGMWDGNDPFMVRHLAPVYTAVGCQMTVTPRDSMLLTLSGSGQYLETDAPALTDFSGGVGLRVRLINRSTCRSLTLRYTTLSQTEYTEKRSLTVAIPEGDGVVSCLFSFPEAFVGRFRLEFDGMPLGEMEILSVAAVPCYTGTPSYGTVSECLIGRNGTTVSVKGKIDEADVERYADCPLYLYELAPWEESNAITTSRTAVGEATLNGADFSFSIPLSKDEEELYTKYAVMIYDGGALIPVGQPRFITNPEALAEDTASVALPSGKGYWPLTGDYLFDGVSYTAVEIRLDRLLSFGEDALTYTVGGETRTFDANYVAELDRRMAEYEACGVSVYGILRVASSSDLSKNELLCHPAGTGGTYAAFNTVSREGILTLRAVAAFLTERYATPTGVSDALVGFTVGSSVNEAADQYRMGYVSLSTFAKVYGNALRTVYNAARSVSSGMEIYMPLGGDWYHAGTTAQRAAFDASSVLDAVGSYLSQSGDIGWKLSYDIEPPAGTYAWEIADPDLSCEAPRITAANLEALIRALSREVLLDKGALRSVLLLETEPHGAEDDNRRIRLSADYVYTYLRLATRAFAAVKTYIPAHPVDYNDAFRYLDTTRFREVTAFAAELMGETAFDTLVGEATAAPRRYVGENRAVTVIPSAVKGEKAIFDFSTDADGWYGRIGCASLKGGTALEGQSGLLSVRLSALAPDVWRGVAVDFDAPLDLSEAPYLGFRFRSAVLPEGVKTLELAVVVTAGEATQISTLTVTAGAETEVVADLTAFPGRSACDGMAVYVRGLNGQDIGEPTLLLGAVRVMSETYSGEHLNDIIRHPSEETEQEDTVTLTTVVAVAAVGILALIAETVRLIKRRETHREDGLS